MQTEKLQRLIHQYKMSMDYYKDPKHAYNEQSCRDEYINPLLECFGWDVSNQKGAPPQYKEVVVEQYASCSERPDYTLTLNGVTRIFVEAKKPGVAVTKDPGPALQARRYGWNAKHKIVILTNFEYLLIYDTTNKPKESDTAAVSLYRRYYFEEYLEKYQEIYELISRESIYTGKFDAFLSENFQNNDRFHTEIDDEFLKMMNRWRLLLGNYLYQKHEKYRDMDVLNDTVQAFINQLIFLRICEDRNLPLYESLKRTAESKKELKTMLTKMVKEADHRYNSGLFGDETVIFDLDSEIIYGMVMSLYYPQSPYLFYLIEPGILGKIYEAFLTERLIEEDGNVVLAPKWEYKYKSVVSTPLEIVKYMVKEALEGVCKGKSPEEILSIKIADIACGSGIFLEEAYQYLVDYCTGWYFLHEPEYLLEVGNGKYKLPFHDKKNILVHCIYGVDIDIHAVEISKFSLLLKLIEDETAPSVQGAVPILPDLQYNLAHGNSLISEEDLKEAASTKELLEIVPFDWKEMNGGRTFDVILGNPPYVKTEDMHALSTELEFKLYKEKYKSACKQFDKYFLFVEKALDLLAEEGILCYIIPNKFFKIAAGQELRKLICKKAVRIEDFGDTQLFPDKTIYSAIVTLRKEDTEELSYTPVGSVSKLWSGEELESVKIKCDSLNQEPWKLTTDLAMMKVMESIREISVSLSKAVRIFNGIQTSAERPEKFSAKKEVYWFDQTSVLGEDERMVTINRYGKVYAIEKSILKPYFKPTKKAEKGMSTYSLLHTDKRIIFPYDEEGRLYPIKTMESVFPGAYNYLLDCYDRLVPKLLNHGTGRDVPNATAQNWYQYGRTQALTAFIHTKKLIVRVLSREPMYAYDKDDMLIASGGTAGYCAIAESPESGYALEYVQAWLVHPYTEKMFQMLGSDFENGFTARGTFLLSKIPFVKLDFSEHIQKTLYDSVVEKSRKIYALNDEMEQKKDRATKSVLEKEKKKLIREIESIITRVYQQKF